MVILCVFCVYMLLFSIFDVVYIMLQNKKIETVEDKMKYLESVLSQQAEIITKLEKENKEKYTKEKRKSYFQGYNNGKKK